jgi:D-glycero-alpha-D-manno-heptose-7-phosphate kinase
MAINKYVHILVNRSPVDKMIRIRYSQSEVAQNLDALHHAIFRETLRSAGINDSVEVVMISDAAPGTGLGSSGSFTVALLLALHKFNKEATDPYSLAEEAYEMEAVRSKITVGKQDQYIACFGGISAIDFDVSGKITVNALKIAPDKLKELTSRLLLFYTGIQRKDLSIPEQQDKETLQNAPLVVENLLKTKRLGLEIKNTLESGDFHRFGELMHEHWLNKKKRSQSMSTSKIDDCYRLARDNGAIGGKLIGAGGGGFLLLYCPDEAKSRVRGALTREGLLEMDYAIDWEGAKVLVDD